MVLLDSELCAGLFGLAAGPVMIADMDHPKQPIIFANRAFSDLTGFASYEVLRQNCSFIQSDTANSSAVEAMQRSIRTKNDGAFVLEHKKKNGGQFHCFVSLNFFHLPSGKNVCLSCQNNTRIENYPPQVFEELARFRGDVRSMIARGTNPRFTSLLNAQYMAADAAKMAFHAAIQSARLRSCRAIAA